MPFFYIYYEKCVKGVLSPDDYGFSPHFPTHCTLKTEYDSKTSPCPSHYEQVKEAWSSLIAMTTRENNGTLVRLGLKPRDDAPTSMGRG